MRFATFAAAGLLLLAAPAIADDLIYHAKGDAPDILTTFDGQAYWKPLARCSGIYTTIGARLRDAGKGDLAAAVDDERNMFMRAYVQRISTDRGLSMEDSLAVAHDFSVDSAAMASDALDQDSGAQGELIEQCEKAYNIIVQETGMAH